MATTITWLSRVALLVGCILEILIHAEFFRLRRVDAQLQRLATTVSSARFQVCGLAAPWDGRPHFRHKELTSQRKKQTAIPRRIVQTGPPFRAQWKTIWNQSYGSWQRHHPVYEYTFLNDSLPDDGTNPNLVGFIRRHYPWFESTWRQLPQHIMRLDVARALWLHTHGGVYADLDVSASADVTPHLRGLDVALPPNSLQHSEEATCWLATEREGSVCGTHIGNWWMASVAGHPLWLDYLRYVAENVGTIGMRAKTCASLPHATCSTRSNGGLYWGTHKQRVMDVLELTGPYALGRVFDAHVQRNPSARIALLSNLSVFVSSRGTASWMSHLKRT